jgi:uncharacterized protein (TIGR01777 family)
MATVLITGGTGLVGKRLTEMLIERNYHIIILSRKAIKNTSSVSYAYWNIEKQEIDIDAIQKADYIVHLSGAGIADKRWTLKRKQEIKDSRIKSAALLVKILKERDNKVQAVISASAVGWYGADTAQSIQYGFVEEDEPNKSFLGETCKLWEESIQSVAAQQKRLVILRTGIVLSRTGGALKEFMKALKFRYAPVLGNGKQIISWIHIDDICSLYIKAIEDATMKGIYNAVANVVTNEQLMVRLAQKKYHGRFIKLFIPPFIIKCLKGEVGNEVLKSTTVNNNKIKATGYVFSYSTIGKALDNLFL